MSSRTALLGAEYVIEAWLHSARSSILKIAMKAFRNQPCAAQDALCLSCRGNPVSENSFILTRTGAADVAPVGQKVTRLSQQAANGIGNTESSASILLSLLDARFSRDGRPVLIPSRHCSRFRYSGPLQKQVNVQRTVE